MSFEVRLNWAVAEVQGIIDGAIRDLAACRASLDTTQRDRGRAEAAERSLLDLGPQGTALRRYAGAAERTMFKTLQELRSHRAEVQPATSIPAEALTATLTEIPTNREVTVESASFCPEPVRRADPSPPPVIGSVRTDGASPGEFRTIDDSPRQPVPPTP